VRGLPSLPKQRRKTLKLIGQKERALADVHRAHLVFHKRRDTSQLGRLLFPLSIAGPRCDLPDSIRRLRKVMAYRPQKLR
jgi:hypothetical protein